MIRSNGFGLERSRNGEIINYPINSRSVRILFLALDVDLSSRTGDSTHTRELVTSLSRIGNEVALVSYAPEESLRDVSTLFGGMGVSVHIPQKSGNLPTLRFCSQLAREFKPDVIYERRFSPKISGTLSKMLSVPSVVEINAMIEEELKILGKEEKGVLGLDKIKRRIRRYFLRSADGIVAVSSGIGAGLVEEYDVNPSKIHVVHNGANTDLFRPMDRSTCMKRLGLDEKMRYLCFSGSLAPWQGVEDLIPVLNNLRSEVENVRLLVVGDGELMNDLKVKSKELGIQNAVQFCGYVPYEEVPYHINSAEICVAPFNAILRNVKYGFSAIKLYEYMACGMPFVTTSVCGIEEEIEEKDVGLVVEPDSPKELETALEELLGNSQKAKEMGKRGRSLAEKEHSWISVAKRTTEILEGVAR